MRVLYILIVSPVSSLIHKIIDYLIDSGQAVTIYSLSEDDHISWNKKYKNDLNIVDKYDELEIDKFDYIINLSHHNLETNVAQIIFHLDFLNNSILLEILLQQVGGVSKIHENILERGERSQCVKHNLNNLIDQMVESFIDSIIYLLRLDKKELVFNSSVNSNNIIYDLLEYEKQLFGLYNFYSSYSNDDELFTVQDVIGYTPLNNNYVEAKLKLADKYSLDEIDFEIIGVYFLVHLNAGLNALYNYDFQCSLKPTISKFIDINLLDSYSVLQNKCKDKRYDIINSIFYCGNTLLNPHPKVILLYGKIYANADYDLCVSYDIKTNALIFKYRSDLCFFDEHQRFVENFLDKYQSFKSGSIDFSKLLTINQKYLDKYLVEWNKTSKKISKDKTIHLVFEEQVNRTPNSIAVVYGKIQLTYEELNRKVNIFARYLRNNYDIHPDDLVVLCLERSEYMLITILAILKAGGAYVPIDPEYPKERINYILSDTKPKLILTNSIYQDIFRDYGACVVVEEVDLSTGVSSNLESIVSSSNLAYVIYTSGTTGNPKGVMIEHKGIVNLILQEKLENRFVANKAGVLWGEIFFDLSVYETFSMLFNGCALHVIPKNIKNDVFKFIEYIIANKISYSYIPPYYIKEFKTIKSNLEFISFGVDKVESKDVACIKENHPEIIIFNIYGPTESSVFCTLYDYSEYIQELKYLPIGKPISNVKCYVLNNNLDAMPVGVIGELYIGGEGLARGYLNLPELTAELFIDSPFKVGKKLYKTGDLVRWLSDGNLEYIGRNDSQVKIRGFRVELGEIEVVLSNYKNIRHVVVVAKEDTNGSKYLVLYYVADRKIKEEDILQYLSSRLPGYLIPSILVYLDHLPLTSNGKLDRKALPNPEFKGDEDNYIAPRNDVELKLVEICSEILKLEQSKIGMNDDFFRLGGHSLIAVQLIAKIRSEFLVNLSLSSIFESATIRRIASSIQNAKYESLADNLVLVDRLPLVNEDKDKRYDLFPLTEVQQAYWVGRNGSFELGNVSTYRYSEYDYINNEIDIVRLEESWNKLVERHEALRLVLNESGEQKILKEVPYYKIDILDLRHKSEDDVIKKLSDIRNDRSHRILPYDRWPLFDIYVTKFSNKVRLHIGIDGLLLDAWSMKILFNELDKLYKDIVLPKLNVSFRDYVLTLKDIKRIELYTRDRSYWLERVKSFPSAPLLPLKQNTMQLQEQKFVRCTSNINKHDWRKVQDKAKRLGLSASGLLAMIYAEVLAKWSGDSHFVMNLTLFNRLPLHSQINDIAGDFTSLLLLEVDLKSKNNQCVTNSSFITMALALQQQLWKDLDHNLYSAAEFLRELSSYNEKLTIMPVVFTCVLGFTHDKSKYNNTKDQNDNAILQMERRTFGITQTPQVSIDYRAYEDDNEELTVEWDYVAELFPDDMIPDMHDAYIRLLNNLVEDDDVWERTIDLLPIYQKEIRESSNATKWEVDPVLLHELFHSQAEKLHNQIAVVSSRGNCNYRDLYCYSNQLGYKLRKLGAKPNHLIAIVMEKGWEQVVGVIGILNSGAAYLPIDVEYPEERINQLLEQGEVSIILTQSEYKDKINSLSYVSRLSSVDLISVDKIKEELSVYSSDKLEVVQNLDDLAYVIFTSGSTGVPKGVMMNHRAVSNTILDINDRFNVGRGDRVLALSSLSFDLSVYDIFGLLAAGGTIVMPDSKDVRDVSKWIDLFEIYNISIWNTVPMFMQMLTEFVESDKKLSRAFLDNLRLMLLSGDYIPPLLVGAIRNMFKFNYRQKLQLISLGGATEAAIWSIIYPIEEPYLEYRNIPYGKALRNQRIYILNDRFESCPDYVIGDIYIGGVGLACGYWKMKEKTDKSFIINPHTQERLYKTGDLGKYLPDGNVEFVSRVDNQIKIGGNRIELGEIEYQLKQSKGVKEAVVDVSLDDNGRKELVAYIVPEYIKSNSNTPAIDDRDRLQFKLNQHGRRLLSSLVQTIELTKDNISEDNYFSRKSYRSFEGGTLTKKDLNDLLYKVFNRKKEPICADKISNSSLYQLGKLLGVLSAYTHKDAVLPKYRYASAGSIYAVQTYLEVPANFIKELPAGYYYYDPVKHNLNMISEIDNSNGVNDISITETNSLTLYFVSKNSIIERLYPNLSKNFATLESGYMYSLLESESENLEISLVLNNKLCNESSYKIKLLESSFRLEEGDEIISCSKLSGFNNKNRFIDDFIESRDIEEVRDNLLIYIKDGGVSGLHEGWYCYCDNNELRNISQEKIREVPVLSENAAIQCDASFRMFFTSKNANASISCVNFKIGAIAQKLMEEAIKMDIGLCPIGNIDQLVREQIVEIDKEVEDGSHKKKQIIINHCLVGGKVSKEQIASRITSKARINKVFQGQLQNRIEEYLPDYMIPKHFVLLDEFPLTSSGKLDRRALPDPEFKGDEFNYVAPRNEIESKLVDIWSEILKLEQMNIGVDDDFFRLGGDSIIAIKLVSKINKIYNSQVKIQEIFEHRNIAGLSKIIQHQVQKEELPIYNNFSLLDISEYQD